MSRTKHTQGKGRHGFLKNGAQPPEHALWKMMIQRCYNPKSSEYQKFGAVGIRVAERWLEQDGFANFLADVGPQPFPGAGLCRLDPSGHLEPGNVIWGNSRAKHVLTHEGRSMPLVDWAKEIGMAPATLRARLGRGWTLKAVLNPSAKFRREYWLWRD